MGDGQIFLKTFLPSLFFINAYGMSLISAWSISPDCTFSFALLVCGQSLELHVSEWKPLCHDCADETADPKG